MDLWFRFMIAVLATWRVTHLLASEDGPADIIVRFRAWLGESHAGKLLDCFYCLSLWVAAPLAVFLSRRWIEWSVAWMALSGGACLIERLTREFVTSPAPSQFEKGNPQDVLWPEASRAEEFIVAADAGRDTSDV